MADCLDVVLSRVVMAVHDVGLAVGLVWEELCFEGRQPRDSVELDSSPRAPGRVYSPSQNDVRLH